MTKYLCPKCTTKHLAVALMHVVGNIYVCTNCDMVLIERSK